MTTKRSASKREKKATPDVKATAEVGSGSESRPSTTFAMGPEEHQLRAAYTEHAPSSPINARLLEGARASDAANETFTKYTFDATDAILRALSVVRTWGKEAEMDQVLTRWYVDVTGKLPVVEPWGVNLVPNMAWRVGACCDAAMHYWRWKHAQTKGTWK